MMIKDTLVRPLVTEKTTTLLGNDRTYAFEVSVDASKPQIKRAVEAFYNVEVDNVRTLIMRGKTKRFGRRFGKRKNWKKAYVTLCEGHALNLFE
ncbi:MAG: 50S ribosomal protein L23 [Myxococcales bacterium]|nr:50S ribosomal protein L23 [Myxococcales bacterium]